jgi:hypothetical protein
VLPSVARKQRFDPLSRSLVQVGGGFVEEEHARFPIQGAQQRKPLTFAARQPIHRPGFSFRGQAQRLCSCRIETREMSADRWFPPQWIGGQQLHRSPPLGPRDSLRGSVSQAHLAFMRVQVRDRPE